MSEHDQDRPRPKPVDYDELFPGRFVKAGLLKGEPKTVTILDVTTEPLPQDKGADRIRGILSFVGTDTQMVLNSTNGQCLRAMFGKRIADWMGKAITLVPEKDRMGGEVVDAIRISGSPDISEPITVVIKLPRKKPRQRVLQPTKAAPARTSQPRERQPGED
jgi:hypothetical protein